VLLLLLLLKSIADMPGKQMAQHMIRCPSADSAAKQTQQQVLCILFTVALQDGNALQQACTTSHSSSSPSAHAWQLQN